MHLIKFPFHDQWFKLKKYANNNGIKIIGDMPIYSAYDSTEVWSESQNFYLIMKQINLILQKIALFYLL